MNPWDAEGSLQPFSYASYRIQAALLGTERLSGIDARVMDADHTNFMSAGRWVERILDYGPDVVGASAYVWSLPTFVEVLRQVKAAKPETLTVIGGPSARPEMLALPPYRDSIGFIDALVPGEGEHVICEIAEAYDPAGTALRAIPGLVVSDGRRWHATPDRPAIDDLDALPSPFQLGLAPRGVTAHLEAFRGCPMSCTFCQWGARGNGRPFLSKGALVRELRAFEAADATGVLLVDAGLNLNSRAFRALRAAEDEVGFLEGRQLATEVYPSLLTEEHLEFIGRAPRAWAGVGLQSLDAGVLKGVERPFSRARFDRVIEALARVAQTTIELIVGLPGDTPERFLETFRQVRELPCSLRVYHCLVLPDALLTRAPPNFAMNFDPVSLEMKSCLGWSERELQETVDFLSEEVAKSSGWCSRYHPRPVNERDWTHEIGRPVGVSMWMFPNLAHEAFHRTGGGGRRPEDLPALDGTAAREAPPPRETPLRLAVVAHEPSSISHASPPEVPASAESGTDPKPSEEIDVAATSSLAREIRRVIDAASGRRWRVLRIWRKRERLCVDVQHNQQRFSVWAEPHVPGAACYRELDGVAFSYLSSMPGSELPIFDQVIPPLRRATAEELVRLPNVDL